MNQEIIDLTQFAEFAPLVGEALAREMSDKLGATSIYIPMPKFDAPANQHETLSAQRLIDALGREMYTRVCLNFGDILMYVPSPSK